MKKFWIEPAVAGWKKVSPGIRLRFVYILLLVLSFSFFSFYAKITGWFLSPNKIDIFQDLHQLAFYFWVVDPEVSRQLLTLDTVIQGYLKGENVLQEKEEELLSLWLYVKDKKDYLVKMGFSNYERILTMIADSREMREEIFQLLGRDQEFNYLILLQNGNESRPNGGFFGSFLFVSLEGGHVKDFQVLDSYLPDVISPNTRIPLPDWMQQGLGDKFVGFVSGNKYGFTDKDGKNIKTLFERVFGGEFDESRRDKLISPEKWEMLFGKYIKGVIFLDSTLISYLMPSFHTLSWRWQFVNANIDIIRGENRSNKKEVYMKELEQYLSRNMLSLVKNFLNSVQNVLDKRFINLYFSNISDTAWDFLKKYDLTTIYNPNYLYFWNENTSFNKSDGFIDKQIEIQDEHGVPLFSTKNRLLDIRTLTPWTYSAVITYTLDIPKSYHEYIFSLEKEYGIEMTKREKYILVCSPESHYLPTQQWWSAKEIIYFPEYFELLDVSWDALDSKHFNSDFAKVISYTARIVENPHTNTVKVNFRIP